jgi:hypothetical protein
MNGQEGHEKDAKKKNPATLLPVMYPKNMKSDRYFRQRATLLCSCSIIHNKCYQWMNKEKCVIHTTNK